MTDVGMESEKIVFHGQTAIAEAVDFWDYTSGPQVASQVTADEPFAPIVHHFDETTVPEKFQTPVALDDIDIGQMVFSDGLLDPPFPEIFPETDQAVFHPPSRLPDYRGIGGRLHGVGDEPSFMGRKQDFGKFYPPGIQIRKIETDVLLPFLGAPCQGHQAAVMAKFSFCKDKFERNSCRVERGQMKNTQTCPPKCFTNLKL
jgi:hypothetical protein